MIRTGGDQLVQGGSSGVGAFHDDGGTMFCGRTIAYVIWMLIKNDIP